MNKRLKQLISRNKEFWNSMNKEDKKIILEYIELDIRSQVAVLDFIEFKKNINKIKKGG